jgi:MSHA biogenesis protein MshJ
MKAALPLGPIWRAQARRIDALSLRERAIMFASVALALGAVADALVISPLFAERRQLATQIRKQAADLDALRIQLAAAEAGPRPDTPQGRAQLAIDGLRAERARLDERTRGLLAGRQELARFNDVLDRVLQRHPRLTLTRVTTLPDSALAAPAGAAPAIVWQGVDLSLSGRYLDLMRYLAELEQALPGLRWGELKIAARTLPPEMTVRLMMAASAP